MTTHQTFDAISFLRPFMLSELEDCGPNWWNELVLHNLPARKRDRAWRMGSCFVDLMDLYDVLAVLKGNWQMIADRHFLDDRYWGLLCHLQQARNARAHQRADWGSRWEMYDCVAVELLRDLVQSLQRKAA